MSSRIIDRFNGKIKTQHLKSFVYFDLYCVMFYSFENLFLLQLLPLVDRHQQKKIWFKASIRSDDN